MAGLTPRAFSPVSTKIAELALKQAKASHQPELKQAEGFRVRLHEEGGILTLYALKEPQPISGLCQELLCENLLAIQELYMKGRQGQIFGWTSEGYFVKATEQAIDDVESFLRKEGRLHVLYGLMSLQSTDFSDLKTNDRPVGVALSHPLLEPQSWHSTPWEAKNKAKYISDVIQLMTGCKENLSYCYCYFCEIELPA